MSTPIETAAPPVSMETISAAVGRVESLNALLPRLSLVRAVSVQQDISGAVNATLRASLVQHRDDMLLVYVDHEPVPCSRARAGEPVQRWWLCETCGWESPHRRARLAAEKYEHALDAVLAYLTGEPS